MGCLTCFGEVAHDMLRTFDDGPVIVVMTKMKRLTNGDGLLASPACEWLRLVELDVVSPHGEEVSPVPALCIGAARFITCRLMRWAVAGLSYAWTSTECAYGVRHHITT